MHALHFPDARWIHYDIQWLAQLPFERLHDLAHTVFDPTADVEDLIPFAHSVQKCEHRVGHVSSMDEIAFGIEVPKLQFTRPRHHLSLYLGDQVRIGLVGPEGVEETANDHRDPRAQMELAGQPFRGQFRDAVDIQRRYRVLFAQRPACDRIYRGSARHEHLLYRSRVRTGIEHVDRSGDIDLRGLDRVRVAIRNEMHRCKMHNDLRCDRGQRTGERIPIANVLNEEAIIGDRDQLAATERKIIDHEDLIAVAEKMPDQRRTDEPGPTGHKHLPSHAAKLGRTVLVAAAMRSIYLRGRSMKVSVIIPCFNVERYVERAVKSALQQTHAELEVICVDDGSTDGTLPILEAMRNSDPRIEVIARPNRGACAARNAGMNRARGIYLQFLDADDEILPEKIAHQIALAERSHLPALIIGSSRTIAPAGEIKGTVQQRTGGRDPWSDLMAHRMSITSTNLWSRKAVEHAGGWNEALASSQEYDLMFRMLKNGASVIYDDRILTHIHQRSGGSISQTNLDRNWVRSVELREKIIAHLIASGDRRDLRPFHQVLFDDIRTLYLHSPEKAIELYERAIPKEFVPMRSTATGGTYLLLHRLLGFKLANRVRRLFG